LNESLVTTYEAYPQRLTPHHPPSWYLTPKPLRSDLKAPGPLTSSGFSVSGSRPFEYRGKSYSVTGNNHWKVSHVGLERLKRAGYLVTRENSLAYYLFLDAYSVVPITNNWIDTNWGFDAGTKAYVVQTNTKVITRCLLMTTTPGDLVLDPTCGSGSTAYVAEQRGRRWITIDTSRVSVAIARQRRDLVPDGLFRKHWDGPRQKLAIANFLVSISVLNWYG
jgi:adenine-specific DNA-methyltransferase